MKKAILLAMLITGVLCASAQNIRLNLYGSYAFDDSYDFYNNADNYFDGTIKGGFQWGAGVEYLIMPNYGVELMYLRQSTKSPTTFKAGSQSPVRNEDFELNLNYLMLAGVGQKMTGTGKVEGYGALMGGLLFSNVKVPSTGNEGSNTSFAWGAKVGANIWTSPKIGIKLQAQLLSSSQATGGDLYFSYWGPVVLDTYSTLWQFSLGGGLTFRLGK